MQKVVSTIRRERVAENFGALVSPPAGKVQVSFDFQDVDSCVFSGRRLELVQQPKPYQNQKLVLLVLTTPSSPFFEFHLQQAARFPQHVHCIVAVEGLCQESLKQMTRRSYFAS